MKAGTAQRIAKDCAAEAGRDELRIENQRAMDTMPRERSCTLDSCKSTAVAVLADQSLCLSHFFTFCYEHLEKFDPRGRRRWPEVMDIAAQRRFVEECSRAALDLTFRCETLTNLQRARLLDIMLWAGELFLLLRTTNNNSTESSGTAHRAAFRVPGSC